MKIQISPERTIDGYTTVWPQAGPDVDIVMDPKALTFRPGSLDEICTFHVLDQLFIDEARTALRNWFACLKPGGRLYITVDDFEYVARAFVGGDISIDMFNEHHSHATQFDQKLLGTLLLTTGFLEPNIAIWFEGVPDLFKKKHYEIVISAQK